MAYLHGAYGEIGESKVASVTQADVVAAYIGTAPVNLIRGYADKDLVNMPVKVTNMSEVQSLVGYSDDWETFTLGSAFAEHFDNTVGNVGPIYIVNVLDPAVHKSAQKTTKALTFTDGKAEFESDKIILDTFAIADKAEGVDYALSYSMAKHTVTVTLLKETGPNSPQPSTPWTLPRCRRPTLSAREPKPENIPDWLPWLYSISITTSCSIFWQLRAGVISRPYTRPW